MGEKKTKSKSIKENILKFLFVFGKARAVDVVRYANYKYETTLRGASLCKEMVEDGYIAEATYLLSVSAREGRRKVRDKVYGITPKGREYILEVYPHIKSKGEYLKQSQTLPEESKELDVRLTERGVLLNFWAVGVAIFPDEKPSLDHLQITIGNVACRGKDIPKGYKDDLGYDECMLFMNNRIDKKTGEMICGGAYYTIREFTKYIKRNETLADTFSGTRARGIFVSWNTCYVVYAAKRYSNRMLNVKYKSEKALLTAIKKTFMFTDIYRPIKELSSASHVRENKPAAIVFSDGKRLAYEMSTGDTKGQRKGSTDMIQLVTDLERHNALHESGIKFEKEKKDAEIVPSTYLTAGSEFFEDMYVAPMSLSGMDALKYLAANTKENIIAEARSVIESIPDFYKDKEGRGLYPYHNKRYPDNPAYPEYVPVLNVKQMRWIRERGGEPFIITDKDLLDPVAHSIKLRAKYYDISTAEEYPKNSVFIYTDKGEIAGLEILRRALKERGLTFKNPYSWSENHKRMGLEHIALYNMLAGGEADVEAVIANTDTKPVGAKKKREKKIRTSASLDEYLVEFINKKAKEEGISASAYLSRLVRREYLKEKGEEK